jgi:transcriptional regulator with XRE-family HTH domain
MINNSQNLIKKIRKESGLTQGQLADALKVSKVLIAMIESDQKPISKKMILKLADVLNISPFSLKFSLFSNERDHKNQSLSPTESRLLKIGEKLQNQLIIYGSKNLKKYVK